MSQINESAIATPGVYINKINSFPPSVAQVSTAIPVFVGYTAQAVDSNGNSAIMEAIQISSFPEYVKYFGGLPTNLNTVVTLNEDYSINSVDPSPAYQMYNSVYMFFLNGGGVCYILSVGIYYTTAPLVYLSDFMPTNTNPSCFDIIQKIDDITLLLFPDAVLFCGKTPSLGTNSNSLTNVNDYYTLMTTALALCGNLQDRFTILDVVNGDMDFDSTDVITPFRTGIGSMNLNYGAVYYPFLETTLALPYDYQNILIQVLGNTNAPAPIYSGGIATNFPEFVSQLETGNTIFTQINAVTNDSINIVDAAFPPSSPLLPFPIITDYQSLVNCLGTLQGYIAAFSGLTGFTDSVTQNNYSNNYIEAALPNGNPTLLEKYIGLYNAMLNDYPAGLTPSALKGATTTAGATLALITSPASLLTYTGSSIQSISVTAGGTGYVQGTAVTINSATGTGFAGIINVNSGAITSISVTNPGSNYPSNATAAISGGTGATTSIVFTDPVIIAPYGSTAPTTFTNALIAILPVLQPLYNNVINLIQRFITDLNARVNALELQLISANPTFSNIYSAITTGGVVVPPSGLLAGVYAATDGTRGVWKAPANVSLNGVIAPTVKINDQMQEGLNIDTIGGKSVNAIRTFSGQGTLVWGARTLAGNDNNWRYIPVRRFYIMVETSVKYAAFQFVFEPNVGTTWARIQSMIESYLTSLWRLGALAGSKAEQAFYVSVGLGQTMTQDDILNGRLIVEIGMAPVRPAEFIILRFTQMQQQA